MVTLTHSTDFRKLRPFRWLTCFRYVMYLDLNNIGQVVISSYMFPSWVVKMVKRYMSTYQFGNLSQRLWAKAPLHSTSTNLPLTSNDGRYRQTTAVKSSSVSAYIHACWVYNSLHKIPFWIKVISLYDRLTKCMFWSCGSEFDDGKILSEDWAQACGNGRRCSTPFPHLTWTNWLVMSRNFHKA